MYDYRFPDAAPNACLRSVCFGSWCNRREFRAFHRSRPYIHIFNESTKSDVFFDWEMCCTINIDIVHDLVVYAAVGSSAVT